MMVGNAQSGRAVPPGNVPSIGGFAGRRLNEGTSTGLEPVDRRGVNLATGTQHLLPLSVGSNRCIGHWFQRHYGHSIVIITLHRPDPSSGEYRRAGFRWITRPVRRSPPPNTSLCSNRFQKRWGRSHGPFQLQPYDCNTKMGDHDESDSVVGARYCFLLIVDGSRHLDPNIIWVLTLGIGIQAISNGINRTSLLISRFFIDACLFH